MQTGDIGWRIFPDSHIGASILGLIKGLTLRIFPATAADVVRYSLRYELSVGEKTWTQADYALPAVDLGPPGPVQGDGKIEYDLSLYSELAGLDGIYDIGVTAVDDVGNESDFLDLEDASIDFTPPDAPSGGEFISG